MAPWKALCDGPIPGGRGPRSRDEGPISTRQECTEAPPGARHSAQLGEERRTVVSGPARPGGPVRRAPGIALHRPNSGDLCCHCPRTATTQSESGELWMPAATEDPKGTILLSAQDSPRCSILGDYLSLCRWRCGCHGNIKVPRGCQGDVSTQCFLLYPPAISSRAWPPNVPHGTLSPPARAFSHANLSSFTIRWFLSETKVDF